MAPIPRVHRTLCSEESKSPHLKTKVKGGTVSFPPRKKRAASEDWEEKAPKRGKMPLSGGSGLGDINMQSHDEDKPQDKS